MMNEFTVWDNLEEEFIDEEYIARYSHGILFKADIDNELIDLLHNENDDKNRYVSFDYIRKTDINDKKIYADCSIFEFEYRDIARVGFFNFDDLCSRYIIKAEMLIASERASFMEVIYYHPDEVTNIKIIGTLQENKNLLKEES